MIVAKNPYNKLVIALFSFYAIKKCEKVYKELISGFGVGRDSMLMLMDK